MKVETTNSISDKEAKALREEEQEIQEAQEAFERKMNETAETAYFTMCKNEKAISPLMYDLRDRVAGVITGSYTMELLSQKDYYLYQDAKNEFVAKLHKDICCSKKMVCSKILDTYNNDNCINNMIYFDFILYLEERQGIFYKSIDDNDYRALSSLKKNPPPCWHTWERYQFDTKKKGERYTPKDDYQNGRHICAIKNYLPVIDKCIQKEWRSLFIKGNTNQRTHYKYLSLYELFLPKEEKEKANEEKGDWKNIYILESFTGFLLTEHIYYYFLPYLYDNGMSDAFDKMLKLYIKKLAKIKHPFLRLYALEMTKISYSSCEELESKFLNDKYFIMKILHKINQTYTIKWENAKRRIDRHLEDYWNDYLTDDKERQEVHNVIDNAYNNLEQKLFYINGFSDEKKYSSYYDSKALTMSDKYKDEWYTYISNMIYEAINT